MSTLIAMIVYGAFAIGYVLILALTERSASTYVANGCTTRHERTTIALAPVMTAPATATTPAAARTAHAA